MKKPQNANKPRRVSPDSGEKKRDPFSPATCASEKTQLRPQTHERSECAAADCKNRRKRHQPFSTSVKLIDPSMWKFLLVGVANTLLSMVLMFLLEFMGYWPSTAIAYVAGAVLSFFLNRSFTFQSNAAFWPSVLRFAVNVAVCYLIAYSIAQPLVTWVLARTTLSLIWQERVAKLFGMGLYTVINYFGQRFFAFRNKS